MYISAVQTIPEISEQIKLTRGVIESLLDFAKKEALVEIRGPSEKSQNIMRYAHQRWQGTGKRGTQAL